MEQKTFSQIGEKMYCQVLENGLHVFVIPKPEFQKSYAFFATNYGGMDMRFCLDGEWHDTPAGVAHYLEHKMFDTQEGNALQILAENGASPNAFTSSAITGYYFESTEKFEENLKILLSFVSIPWFTKESVDKEQGIIGQEIRMVEDDPMNQVFYGLMEGLYGYHPIQVPIAGTVESISHITAETLNACHKAFYDPANMTLCVAGNVDPERICALAREILPKQAGPIAQKDYGQAEEPKVAKALVERHMSVSTPIFQLGFKGDDPGIGVGALRQQLVAQLAFEALLGNSTPLYARLYNEGLINQNFMYDYEGYPNCSFLVAAGESKDPIAVRDAVLAEGWRVVQDGIDAQLWARIKKGVYGSKVRSLNSFENICVGQAQAYFAGYDYFDFAQCYAAIEKSDAEALIAAWVREERTALCVIWPGEGA